MRVISSSAMSPLLLVPPFEASNSIWNNKKKPLIYQLSFFLIRENAKLYEEFMKFEMNWSHEIKHIWQSETQTRGSKEPVSLTLVYVQRTKDAVIHDKIVFWWWRCVCRSYFTEHSWCLQLSLSIMNLAQRFQWKLFCKNLQNLWKLLKIDYTGQ